MQDAGEAANDSLNDTNIYVENLGMISGRQKEIQGSLFRMLGHENGGGDGSDEREHWLEAPTAYRLVHFVDWCGFAYTTWWGNTGSSRADLRDLHSFLVSSENLSFLLRSCSNK